MKECIGRIVTSRAGRDKGRRFVILALCDDAHVWIADGKVRKAAKPKKKKLMHLHFEPASVDMRKKPADPGVVDAWLRACLAAPERGEQTTSKEG